jgi:hypothetical protein
LIQPFGRGDSRRLRDLLHGFARCAVPEKCGVRVVEFKPSADTANHASPKTKNYENKSTEKI